MTNLIRFILALSLVFGLAILAGSSLTQAQDDAQPELVIDIDNAAVRHGETWDNQYTDSGAVMYHDDQFHMFRNGFIGWPAAVQIAYTTSEDGVTWEKQGDDPVLRTDDIEYAGIAALASSALVEEDGTWVLYFYTWPRPGASDGIGGIGRATAPAPEGPWTPADDLVLYPGDQNDWDNNQLISPSVLKTDDGYVMYYHSLDLNGVTHIGMATSEDGIKWAKYDDSTTTETPFANSDPVFSPNIENEEAWDTQHVNQPRVVQTEDGFVMLYRSWTGAQQNQSVGFATSEDGIKWTRVDNEAVFTSKDTARRSIWFTGLVYQDGVYYVYLELQRGYQSQTDIYAGTYAANLWE